MADIEVEITDLGGVVPWARDIPLTVYVSETGHHSRGGCVESEEAVVTLEQAWGLNWAECAWCEGVDGYAPGREVRTALELIHIIKRENPTWGDVVRDEGVLWRDLSGDLSVLRSAAGDAHEARRADVMAKTDVVDVWGMFCAPALSYNVIGRDTHELAAWIKEMSRGVPRRQREVEREFREALKRETWTWGVWMSPASIDVRGAAVRAVARETRRLDGSSYTISYGFAPEAFLKGLEMSGRVSAGCQTEAGAKLAYMIHQTPRKRRERDKNTDAEDLRGVVEGCEVLVARRGEH